MTTRNGVAAITRTAEPCDLTFLVEAVRSLVAELRGTPTAEVDLPGALAAARSLVSRVAPGAALIATDGAGRRIGMATTSYQEAIRAGGRYAVIQELWVEPAARGAGVGRALVSALCTRAATDGCAMVEVGLPGPGSPVFTDTRAGYLAWGFQELGPRMRRALPARGRRTGDAAG